MSLPLEAGPGVEAILLLLRVSLLFGGALAMGRMLRDAEPLARHRLWTGTLLLALLLPILPRFLPQVPLPGIAVTVPQAERGIHTPAAAGTAGPARAAAYGAPAPPLDRLPGGLAEPLPGSHGTAPPVRDPDAAGDRTPKPAGFRGAWREAPGPLPPGGASILSNLWLLLLGVWGAGSALSLAGLGVGLLRGRSLLRRASRLPVGHEIPSLRSLASRAGLPHRRSVRVRVSSEISVPMAGGLFRPGILLPQAALGWTRERLEAVLLHELVHLARHDPARLVLSRIVVALYWFHPLARRVHARASEAREEACDARVVALMGHPSRYARHLLALAASHTLTRVAVPAPAGFTGLHPSHLERRLMAILDPLPAPPRPRNMLCLAGGLVWALALAACAPTLVQEAPVPDPPVVAPDAAGPPVPEVSVAPVPDPPDVAPDRAEPPVPETPATPVAQGRPDAPPSPADPRTPESPRSPAPGSEPAAPTAPAVPLAAHRLLEAERHRLQGERLRIEEVGPRLRDQMERLEDTGPRLEGTVVRLEVEPLRLRETVRRLQGEVERLREGASSQGWDEASLHQIRDHARTLGLLEARLSELASGAELAEAREALEAHNAALTARIQELEGLQRAHEGEMLRGERIRAIQLRLSEIAALLEASGGTP